MASVRSLECINRRRLSVLPSEKRAALGVWIAALSISRSSSLTRAERPSARKSAVISQARAKSGSRLRRPYSRDRCAVSCCFSSERTQTLAAWATQLYCSPNRASGWSRRCLRKRWARFRL